MRKISLCALLMALAASGCASAPDTNPEGVDEPTGESPSHDAGIHDARASSTSSTSTNTSARSDAGTSITISQPGAGSVTASSSGSNPLSGLTGILDGVGGSGDAGKPASKPTDGGADMCANLVCFDIFDCALWHPDAISCGFTSCTGFVCTK